MGRHHAGRGGFGSPPAGSSPIAKEALERIAALYAVEKDIRGRNAEERRAARHQRSRPLTDAIEPWLRAKLGLISQKSKLAEAIREFERALAINPDYADAHNNLGIALGSSGDFAKAIEHFRRALEIRPGYADAQNNLKLFLSAEASRRSPGRSPQP